MITTARYLAALWRTPCYDCWEEHGADVHISTLGAIYAGGVARCGPIANPLSWTHANI